MVWGSIPAPLTSWSYTLYDLMDINISALIFQEKFLFLTSRVGCFLLWSRDIEDNFILSFISVNLCPCFFPSMSGQFNIFWYFGGEFWNTDYYLLIICRKFSVCSVLLLLSLLTSFNLLNYVLPCLPWISYKPLREDIMFCSFVLCLTLKDLA